MQSDSIQIKFLDRTISVERSEIQNANTILNFLDDLPGEVMPIEFESGMFRTYQEFRGLSMDTSLECDGCEKYIARQTGCQISFIFRAIEFMDYLGDDQIVERSFALLCSYIKFKASYRDIPVINQFLHNKSYAQRYVDTMIVLFGPTRLIIDRGVLYKPYSKCHEITYILVRNILSRGGVVVDSKIFELDCRRIPQICQDIKYTIRCGYSDIIKLILSGTELTRKQLFGIAKLILSARKSKSPTKMKSQLDLFEYALGIEAFAIPDILQFIRKHIGGKKYYKSNILFRERMELAGFDSG